MLRGGAPIALLVLAVVAALGAPPAVGAEPAGWSGTWQTDRGTWVLEQSGDQVFGTYDPDAGRVVGTVTGNQLRGTWSQAPSYAPPDDAGDLELVMDAFGITFAGRLRNGSTGDWQTVFGRLDPAGGPSDDPGTGADPGAAPVPLTMASVDLPADLAQGRLHALAAGGQGMVAVGSSGSFEAPRALILAASAAGGPWDVVPLEGTAATGDIIDVTPFGEGFAAIGRTASDGTQAWLSVDGQTWRAVGSPAFEGIRPSAITAWDGGLVAMGCRIRDSGECRPAVGLVSGDGRAWTRTALGIDGTWEVRDVADMDGRLVVVGSTPQGEADTAAITGISDDATTWDAQAVLAPALLDGVVAADDGTATATGWRLDPAGSAGIVLRSEDDGETWQDTGLTAGTGSLFTGLVTADAGTIVVGGFGPPASETSPAAWWVDATGALQPVAEAPGAVAGMGIIEDALPDPGGLAVVAVGMQGGFDATQPALWVIAPGTLDTGDGPSASPSPGPTPARTPVPRPRRTPPPTPRPTPAGPTAAEAYLLAGLPVRERARCEPRRVNNPDGTIAAIDCDPSVHEAQAASFYLMSATSAMRVLRERSAEHLTPSQQKGEGCWNGKPGPFVQWALGGSEGGLICYKDDEGRPNLRMVEDWSCHPDPLRIGGVTLKRPTVYVGVLGRTTIRKLFDTWNVYWRFPDGEATPPSDSTGGRLCPAPYPKG